MNYRDKTKDELVQELQKLHLEYDSLKALYNKDRSDRQRSEDKLLQSEKQYRTLAENTSLIIARLDRNFRHLYVNPAAYRITGIQPEEYLGKTHRELGFPPEQCDFWEATIEKVFTTRKSVKESFVYTGILGEMYLDWRLYPEFDAQGKVVSVLSNVHDITELNQVTVALKESREQYRIMTENIKDVVWVMDIETMKFLYVSPSVEKLRGYTPEEVLAYPVTKALSPESADLVMNLTRNRVDALISAKESPDKFYTNEIEQPCKDGSTVWTEVITSYYINPVNGKVEVRGVTRDITERKLFEKEVQLQSEIMKNITEGVYLISLPEEKIVFTNPKFDEMFGYEHGEMIGKHVSIVNAPADKSPEDSKREIMDILNITGEWHGEILNIKKNGDQFWCFANVSVLDHSIYGKVIVSVHTDISERKKAEKALRESELIFRLLFENSGEAILLTNSDGTIFSANPEACRIFGRGEDEIRKLGRNGICDSNDPRLGPALQTRFQSNKFKGELNLLRKDGTIFPAEITSTLFKDASGNERTSMIIRDISDRKKAEDDIKKALEWENAIFEGSRDSIFISDMDSRFIAVNKAACDLTGYSRKKLLKMKIPDIHDFTDLEAYRKYHKRIFEGEEILSEAKVLRSDGTKIDTEFNNRCVSIGGTPYMHTTGREITERKKSEETLNESENRYRLLFNASPDGIVLIGTDGLIKSANLAQSQMYGCDSPEELVGTSPLLLIAPSMREYASNIMKQRLNGVYFPLVEYKLIRKDGTFFYGETSAAILRDSDNKVAGYICVTRDKSDQKKVEEDLKESEAAFRNIFENSVMGISQTYPDGRYIRINQAYAEMYGYLDTATMLKEIPENTMKLFANPSDREKVLEILDKSGYMEPTEFELKRRNGENFWAFVSAKQVRDETGKLLYLQAEHIDITELKSVETKLKESQKKYRNLSHRLEEILEKERSEIAVNLHDDLGQKLTALDLDLAWIRGRIGVQSLSVKKKLTEMSLMINEILDSIKEISSLLRPSILFDLGLFPAITSLLEKFEKSSGITCNLKFGSNEIFIEDRISLIIYRVIQEALTNIARHSEATKVEITISLTKDRIEMEIGDNGKGIDDEKVNSITSMGITGMKERVRSVNGKMQFRGRIESGTIIMVSIPLNEINND